MDLGFSTQLSAARAGECACYMAARVAGSAGGLLSAQVYMMGACLRCLQCGSEVVDGEYYMRNANSVAYCERSFKAEHVQVWNPQWDSSQSSHLIYQLYPIRMQFRQ